MATIAEKIYLMSPEERMKFWLYELSKCIKCYGCRDSCPLCTCEQCEIELDEWVKKGRIPPKFPYFHIVRAYHIGNRCLHCGECECACPMGIPLRALQQLIRFEPPETVFEYLPGLSADAKETLINAVRKNPIEKRTVKKV